MLEGAGGIGGISSRGELQRFIESVLDGSALAAQVRGAATPLGTVLKLAVTGTERKIAWSNGAVTIPLVASTTGTLVVAHGLGKTPQNVQALLFGTPVSGTTLSVTALDATNLTLRAVVPAAVTGSVFVFWLAIA